MTDTDLITADSATQTELPGVTASRGSAAVASDKSGGSLTSMVLPELRALAVRVGVKGTSGMRKGDLIAAIRERQSSAPANGADRDGGAAEDAPAAAPASEGAPAGPRRRERRSASRQTGAPAETVAEQPKQVGKVEQPAEKGDKADSKAVEAKTVEAKAAEPEADKAPAQDSPRQQDRGDQQGGEQSNRNNNRNNSGQNDGNRNNDRNESNRNNSNQNNNQNNNDDDDGEGRGGRRGRRFRDRKRRGERGGGNEGGNDTELREDDVVQPVAGILDVLDNYAFVRTSGYLAGPNDVYVSMNMVRKNGLRRGDAVTGAVRVPREGGDGGGQNPRQKFNPLVRLDTVNGGPVDAARNRPDFTKLTPLYPNQRLRLETTPDRLTTRVIDLIMPIGKGQRALIVSPPKAGKTTIMQDIANAITRNNPECHLMVVLVDERPEEVTDMQRSVKGEVIASTFDRPPSDHTQAAELAIERAKRLVEQGKDVVVLLDSITRLGRAYNNASPASGRILSGGVDSTALYPPKRFLGAARNIEHGGSLTIIATAMVETGSTGDTVIFEEFKGTGNAELKLDRKIAERRVFPAVDVNPSGTRKDELLLGPDEFAIVHKLRRVLSGLDSHQAIDLLMSQLRKTKTNYEFLVQVSKTAPGSMEDRD
ncbi:transcription termination factor Rho [Mycobacterium sp. MS1601]|uniref:transcription termination factor Rho n=1 Tax=Mycobacterium sp. MS1601 TaxID=1936029 RepID=UPI0009793BB4|nr:transcription termination factor Rho [Mycobacterium sp. MS1601]AQA06536.1 transcription termination factor Rho [Mycobacterium sp. MS1601]